MSGIESPVPKAFRREKPQWKPFVPGVYEKEEYDIITWDARIYLRCYPNGGAFRTRCGFEIAAEEVALARILRDPFSRN